MRLMTKQPSEILDFDIECRKRMDSEDAISTVNASISGPDQGMALERVSHYDDTIAKVYVSGGTNNVTYKITLLVTTRNGRTIETEFLVHVKDL